MLSTYSAQDLRSTCIALIDARYLLWLLGSRLAEEPEQLTEADLRARQHLADRLSAVLHAAGIPAQLARTYWYTSHPEAATIPGQVVRQVPADSADGGAGLILAMARDALRLAQGGACSHLLLASDDDRLLATVDHLQHLGVQVHALADRSAADLLALSQTDPSWASVLKLADTRLVVDAVDAVERAPRGRPVPHSSSTQPPQVHPETVHALVQRWLDALDAAQRAHFRSALPRDMGLPQEADRELLVEISQHLGRPLSVPERKLMRELARQALERPDPDPLQYEPCEEPSS